MLIPPEGAHTIVLSIFGSECASSPKRKLLWLAIGQLPLPTACHAGFPGDDAESLFRPPQGRLGHAVCRGRLLDLAIGDWSYGERVSQECLRGGQSPAAAAERAIRHLLHRIQEFPRAAGEGVSPGDSLSGKIKSRERFQNEVVLVPTAIRADVALGPHQTPPAVRLRRLRRCHHQPRQGAECKRARYTFGW